MKHILNSIVIAITLLAVAAVVYLQSEKWLKQTAVQGCMQVGVNTFNNPEGNSSAQVPDMSTYQRCMQEKGYQ